MASGFKRTSKKSHGGSITTVTQKKGGGVKRTISQSLGSSLRVAYTQAQNGAVIRTTTSKSGDGFVTRKQQTVVKKNQTKVAPQPKPYTAKVAKTNISQATQRTKKPPKLKAQRAAKFNPKLSGVEFFFIMLIGVFGLVGFALDKIGLIAR
jgi:hypothetical protein